MHIYGIILWLITSTLTQSATAQQPQVFISPERIAEEQRRERAMNFSFNFANRVEQDAAAERSPYWLGVRLTAIPDALAAHLGDEGLLVTNIVEGSPADEAGLEKYDIIRRIGGDEVNDLEELRDILTERAGRASELHLVREGERERTIIRPVLRPENLEIEWKYDQAALAGLGEAMDFRVLRFGPNDEGQIRIEGLEDVERIADLLGDMDIDIDAKVDVERLIRAVPGLNEPREFRWNLFEDDEDDDDEHEFHFEIQVMRDGNMIRVEQDDEGNFIVLRENADGEEEETEYESIGEFEAEDPEAFKIFEAPARHSGHHFEWLSDEGLRFESPRGHFGQRFHVIRKLRSHAEELREQAAELSDEAVGVEAEIRTMLEFTNRRSDQAGRPRVLIPSRGGNVENFSIIITNEDGKLEQRVFSDFDEFADEYPMYAEVYLGYRDGYEDADDEEDSDERDD